MYKLKDYPGRIEAAELELLELKNTLDDRKRDLQIEEDRLFDSVLWAKGEDGKPLFTSDTTRQAALRKLKANDGDLIAIEQVVQILETAKAKAGFAVQRLKNEFEVVKLETR